MYTAYIKFKLEGKEKELLYGISVRKIGIPLTDTTHRGSSADVFPKNKASVKRLRYCYISRAERPLSSLLAARHSPPPPFVCPTINDYLETEREETARGANYRHRYRGCQLDISRAAIGILNFTRKKGEEDDCIIGDPTDADFRGWTRKFGSIR